MKRNKRNKIIVTVAGIFIVALALIGLTYAYFLTKINGNSNDKSIAQSAGASLHGDFRFKLYMEPTIQMVEGLLVNINEYYDFTKRQEILDIELTGEFVSAIIYDRLYVSELILI